MVDKRIKLPLARRTAFVDEPRFLAWVLLRQANDIIVRSRDRELRRFNINHEHAATLFLADFLGDRASPAEIARRRFRQPHTVSNVLTNMEKAGLICKTHNRAHRNEVRIMLTKNGQRALEGSMEFGSINRIFGSLDLGERSQMTHYLQLLQQRAIAEFDWRYLESPSKDELKGHQPVKNLFRLLRRTNDIMVQVREKELASHGLSVKIASVLRAVDMLGDDATPAAIARWRYRRPNSISNLLIRMEEDGLVGPANHVGRREIFRDRDGNPI